MWEWIARIVGRFAVEKLPIKTNKMKFGIDISHHQGNVDFAKVATNVPKVDFIYIKATEGVGTIDSKFYVNAENAAKQSIPIGYYHFATLNDEDEFTDAKKEAEWFIQCIKKAPAFQMPLVLDMEDDRKKADLDGQEVLNWINTFFKTLEANGYTDYVLYSYNPFLVSRLPKQHDLGSVRLWIAAYTKKPQPTIPPQWSKYWLWQYAAEGKVNGISTPVDLNKFPD